MKCLGAALVALAVLAGSAQADNEGCRDLFERTSSDVAAAPEVERSELDTPEAGFLLRYGYTLPEALTVQLFDGGHAEISEETVEGYFFKGAQEVVRENKERGYRPKGPPQFYRMDLSDTGFPVVFRMNLYSGSDTAPTINDYLFLYGWGNCMVKMRLTSTEADGEKADSEATSASDRFMAGLPSPS